MTKDHKVQILVAIIGVIGAIIAAIIALNSGGDGKRNKLIVIQCKQGNTSACRQLLDYSGQAVIVCKKQVNSEKLSPFDRYAKIHDCENYKGAIINLVSLVENKLQKCDMIYESTDIGCNEAKNNLEKIFSIMEIQKLEEFMDPVL